MPLTYARLLNNAGRSSSAAPWLLLASAPSIPTVGEGHVSTSPDAAGMSIRLSDLLSALSYALDLAEGEPQGHAARTCLIGMRLAEALRLDSETRAALYYALLLKDAGSPSTAAALADLFACDDQVIKQDLKISDWTRRMEYARIAARCASMSQAPRKGGHVLKIALAGPRRLRALARVRGEYGAAIVRRLGLSEATAEAIRAVDEHWDGRGHPHGVRAGGIPVSARIALLAQAVDAVHVRHGLDAAFEVVRQRRGTWFDPDLVDALCAGRGDRDWWNNLLQSDLISAVVEAEPHDHVRYLSEAGIDEVAEAFAEITDAKTPFAHHNSSEIAKLAVVIARQCGVGPLGQRRIYRAALLHDIGTLGVSYRTLAKPGPLTPDEHKAIERHPIHTGEILSRAGALQDIAAMAALHHERLDGSGYPQGLTQKRLDLQARILAVADVYVAMINHRTYRKALPPQVALALLRSEAEEGCFDARVVQALSRSLPEAAAAAT
jgi:HD-GYP domain-containing protein (c-di-GMP phosphodiesterase class II)